MSMSSSSRPTTAAPDAFGHTVDVRDNARTERRSRFAETKSALKTTEFYAYLAAVAGVLLASYLVGGDDTAGDGDYFAADKAWLYVVILTVGYMIGRGLAKSGARSDD